MHKKSKYSHHKMVGISMGVNTDKYKGTYLCV